MITKGHSFSFLLSAPSVSLPLVPLATQELPGWGGRLFPQPPLSFSISQQYNFVTNSIIILSLNLTKFNSMIWRWSLSSSLQNCDFFPSISLQKCSVFLSKANAGWIGVPMRTFLTRAKNAEKWLLEADQCQWLELWEVLPGSRRGLNLSQSNIEPRHGTGGQS